MKNLEDLFKKTTASPAIYWRPLTEQDIQRRIELRNKVGGWEDHITFTVSATPL